MREKLKVLVTASTFPRWEDDTEPEFVFELTRRLARTCEVFVLCPFASGAKEYEVVENIKIYRYKYLPFGLGTLAYDGGITPKLKKNRLYYLQVPFFLFFQLLAVRRILRSNRIDVVHAHWAIPQGVVAVIYKKLFDKKIRILTTVHGADIFGFRGRLGRALKKMVFRNTDEITVVSNAIAKEAGKYLKKGRLHVYPMGVDTRYFSPAKKQEQLRDKLGIEENFVLFVGRLAEKKGVKYLIEALPEVLKKHPRSQLVIVGDGVLRTELTRMTEDLRIERNVFFAGSLPHRDLAEYFASADVVVVPSVVARGGDSEGFGLVIAEAMSCGAAVVTTDLPAIRDIVKDNETGLIVKQKNAAEIGAKIISLLDRKDALTEMKGLARQHIVRNFDWEVVAEKYRLLLSNMV
jgi:glycosyltransferase involved in cell wall biosynthesis